MAAVDQRQVISDRGDITASWLTAALRDASSLPTGKVRALAVTLWRGKTLSDLYRLEPTYSHTVPSPASFILKLARPDEVSSVANRRRWKEHDFYARLAPRMVDPPIPFPYAAAYDPGTRCSHLLLEDLTTTHLQTPSPLPPRSDRLEGAVDCLADVHASWWNSAEVREVAAERDDSWIDARSASTRRRLDRFLAEFGTHLSGSTSASLTTAAAAWPTILRRARATPLTIVHGDAHPWNFLTPLNADDGRTCLLDWEGWSIEPGPHDLASLIALHLPVNERRSVEHELIARYAGRLRERGVIGYEPSECWEDYRRGVVRRVLSPVGLWSRGSRARSWWPALEHITAAYHDLRCEQIL